MMGDSGEHVGVQHGGLSKAYDDHGGPQLRMFD
jgi:hypothetical protein